MLTIHGGQLAPILGLTASTVKRMESTAPDRLPPFIQVGRKKVYLISTVESWLLQRQQAIKVEPCTWTALPRSLGRPRKGPAKPM